MGSHGADVEHTEDGAGGGGGGGARVEVFLANALIVLCLRHAT